MALSQKELQAYHQFIERQKLYFTDPLLWTREVAGYEPTTQQAQVLSAFPDHRFITIRSGNGIGKTRLMATLALYFLTTRKNSKVPCTAPKVSQLQDSLWGEMDLLIRGSKYLSSILEITSDKVYLKGKGGFWWARAITARKETGDQHAVGLQGLHADELLFIIDEASGITDEVENAIEGAFTGARTRCIMAGNPTRLTGLFWRSFNHPEEAELWKQFHFSSKESSNVDPSFVKRMEAKFGIGSPEYAVKVLGNFPEYDMQGLISADLIEAAYSEVFLDPREPITAGFDIATSGNNNSVIVLRKGSSVYKMIKAPKTVNTEPKVARWLASQILAEKINVVNVDANGLGQAVLNIISEMKNFPSCKINPINNGDAPEDLERFFNVRAETFFYLKSLFVNGQIQLGFRSDELKNQLSTLQYEIREDGRLQIESKLKRGRKGLPSPDEADALCLCFANDARRGRVFQAPPQDFVNSLLRPGISKEPGGVSLGRVNPWVSMAGGGPKSRFSI